MDLHLYMRRRMAELAEKLIHTEEALLHLSKTYADVIFPGYTHMQRAQPVLYLFFDLDRKSTRLYAMADISPLGAYAIM